MTILHSEKVKNVTPRQRGLWVSAFMWMGITWVAVFIAVATGSHIAHVTGHNLIDSVNSNLYVFMAIRLLLIACLGALWPIFARYIAKQSNLNEEETQKLVNKRLNLIIILLILELFFCDNLLLYIVHGIRSI